MTDEKNKVMKEGVGQLYLVEQGFVNSKLEKPGPNHNDILGDV